MSFDFTQESSGTISTGEFSLPAATTVGVPTAQVDTCQVQLWVLIDAMAAGDEFLIQLYEKVKAAGTQVVIDSWRLVYPVDRLVQSGLILHNGWDITIKKIAGTDRTVEWSLRKVK